MEWELSILFFLLSCALSSWSSPPAVGTPHPLALVSLPGRVAGGKMWSLEVSFCGLCPEQRCPVGGTQLGAPEGCICLWKFHTKSPSRPVAALVFSAASRSMAFIWFRSLKSVSLLCFVNQFICTIFILDSTCKQYHFWDFSFSVWLQMASFH